MRDASALIATVDQVAGVATVTVRGEPSTYFRLQDRLVWVAENCPQRLVLDLGESDRFAEQLIKLIAAARRQLPANSSLEVRSASPAVRHLLKVAGLPGVRVTAARPKAEPARLDGHSQSSRPPDPAEIVELVLAGQQRILLLQRALRDGVPRDGHGVSAWALATVWDRLADMIDMHAAAEEEICYLPMFVSSSWSWEQMEDALADLHGIRDAAAEARLLQAGSRSWWRAVTAVLSACAEHFDRQEHGVLADFRSRADRALRQRLGGQWSAFVTAWICDLAPEGQAGDAVCQRCQWPLPASHCHVLNSESSAVCCTCDCCYQLYRWAAREERGDA